MCWKTTGDWRHPLWVSVAGCLGYDVLVQIGTKMKKIILSFSNA
jgi:hypothetical protein